MRLGPTGRSVLSWLLLLLSALSLVSAIDIHARGDLTNSQRYIDQAPCNLEGWPKNWPSSADQGGCTAASAPDPADSTCPVDTLCTTFVPDPRSTWMDEYMPFVPLPFEFNGTALSDDSPGCRMRVRAADSNGNPVVLRTIWETDDTSIPPELVTGDLDHLQACGLGAFTVGFPFAEEHRYRDAVVIPTGTVATGKFDGWPEENALPMERYEEVFGGTGVAMQFPFGIPSHVVVSSRGVRVPGTFYCMDGQERRGNATVPGLTQVAYIIMPIGETPMMRHGPLFPRRLL